MSVLHFILFPIVIFVLLYCNRVAAQFLSYGLQPTFPSMFQRTGVQTPSDYYESFNNPQPNSFVRGITSGFSGFPASISSPFSQQQQYGMSYGSVSQSPYRPQSQFGNGPYGSPMSLQASLNGHSGIPGVPPFFVSASTQSRRLFGNHPPNFYGNLNNGYSNGYMESQINEYPFSALSTDNLQTQGCAWDSNRQRCVDLRNSCRGTCKDISGNENYGSTAPQFHDCRCAPLSFSTVLGQKFDKQKK